MAWLDVHASAFGEGLLLDCQADLLSALNTRFTVPLLAPEIAPTPAGRLNPAFEIGGSHYVMVTQYASAVELRELGPKVASLAKGDREVMNALDLLISGV